MSHGTGSFLRFLGLDTPSEEFSQISISKEEKSYLLYRKLF